MDTPIVLKMLASQLMLIYGDGTVLFIEPDCDVFEPHPS